MDIAAFKTGDMATLAEAVDLLLPDVWRLARRGFMTAADLPHWVQGIARAEDAEPIVAMILARALVPERRAAVRDVSELRSGVLSQARADLSAQGERSGRTLTVATEVERAHVPDGIDDLDRVITGDLPLSLREPPPDAGAEERARGALAVVEEALADLDAQNNKLVELRFREGKSALDTAHILTCGAAAVRSKERRVRRLVQNRLKQRLAGEPRGPAAIDALLARRPTDLLPPPITFERVKKEILKRTFQEEPQPFAKRALWALGASVVAGALWALMFFGVLPNPNDDPAPSASLAIACNPSCSAGASAEVRVTAPKEARFVAVALVDRDRRSVRTILTDEAGRSISLPRGAMRSVRAPYRATLPAELELGSRSSAVALFSKRRLTKAQIVDHAGGKRLIPRVLTTSVAFVAIGAAE